MIYIDTSSFLKLFLVEPESESVEEALPGYDAVFVSNLTELEARVQLRAFVYGGRFTRGFETRVLRDMSLLVMEKPLLRVELRGPIFTTAINQHEKATAHCRSLDCLHLAAMEEIGVRRLMTHDSRQAEAAVALGYKVVSPGWEGG
jgi:predicted nucleic acid-binding protein